MSDTPIVIVGGGPAGMSAAVVAASHGARSILIDEGFDLGGQIYRRPQGAPVARSSPTEPGDALRHEVQRLAEHIDVRSDAAVWGLWKGPRLALSSEHSSEVLAPEVVILATGAYEYVPPFPGWTLPGVMTPGAAQILAKTMGVPPGERIVLAGSGPFLLAVAAQLVARGVEVVSVLEAAPFRAWMLAALGAWRAPGLVAEALGYLARLGRAGVRVRYGRMVTEAEGDTHLAGVTHCPVDGEWTPDPSGAEHEEVDVLCVGYGFISRVSLAQMAGCELVHCPERGGWAPQRDDRLATSVAGILAAGDGAGVGGVEIATLEGRLAGLVAAERLGALEVARFDAEQKRIGRRLARLAATRTRLDRLSAPRRGLRALLRDDTIVCRCEEVPWSEVREAIGHGGTKSETLKVMTRLGMGACQGRSCWPSMAHVLADTLERDPADIGPFSVRPPARPVSLSALARMPVSKESP